MDANSEMIDYETLCKDFTDQYLLSLNSNLFKAINFLKNKKEPPLVHSIERQLDVIYSSQRKYIFSVMKDFGDISVKQLGDVHQNGKCTILVENKTQKFIYKPIRADLLEILNEVLRFLNENSSFNFYILKVLKNNQKFSIIEFIENEKDFEIEAFSYHYGALLFVITLLRGIDFHHENILCVNSTPVVVDCESLFYPILVNTKEYDIDATSMVPTERNKISLMSKKSISISDMRHGIEDACFFLKKKAKNLKDIVNEGNKKTKRLILKPTSFYYEILSKSLHPALLTGYKNRKAFVGECLSGQHVISKAILRSEYEDLMNFNIPYFTCFNNQIFNSVDEKISCDLCLEASEVIHSNINNIDEFCQRVVERI